MSAANVVLFMVPKVTTSKCPVFICDDTIECLETLLDDAKRGRVVGIAFAAVLSVQTFIVDTSGECTRNPVFARGLVASLDDELRGRLCP